MAGLSIRSEISVPADKQIGTGEVRVTGTHNLIARNASAYTAVDMGLGNHSDVKGHVSYQSTDSHQSGWRRCRDIYIDGRAPCCVCGSTRAGAITLCQENPTLVGDM